MRDCDLWRFCQFGVAAAVQALDDAALPVTEETRNDIGVLIGSGIGGIQTLEDQALVQVPPPSVVRAEPRSPPIQTSRLHRPISTCAIATAVTAKPETGWC